MQTKNFTVPNISCGHCTMRVEKALNGLDGITSVNADIPTKAVNIEWDEAVTNWDAITATLNKIGYPPEA